MRFKVPFAGVHVGESCIDGSRMKDYAHAHVSPTKADKFRGYICARSNYDLMKYLRHEVAHLLTGATHETLAEEARWASGLKSIGGRVTARRKH